MPRVKERIADGLCLGDDGNAVENAQDMGGELRVAKLRRVGRQGVVESLMAVDVSLVKAKLSTELSEGTTGQSGSSAPERIDIAGTAGPPGTVGLAKDFQGDRVRMSWREGTGTGAGDGAEAAKYVAKALFVEEGMERMVSDDMGS